MKDSGIDGRGSGPASELEFRLAWWRRQGIAVADGVLMATGVGEPYFPLDGGHTNMPNALAAVTDLKGAVAFAEEYGLLGFRELWLRETKGLAREPGSIPSGDPLPWVLGQAETIRFAQELLEALHVGNRTARRYGAKLGAEKAGAVLEAHRVSILGSEFMGGLGKVEPPGATFEGLVVYEGPRRRFQMFPPTGAEAETDHMNLVLARRILASLVAANTVGLRQRLQSRDNRLGLAYSADALIEVVWHHLEAWALAVEAGGELRRCERCGRLFKVTDQRQRFCPASGFKAPNRTRGLSACGAVSRKRRQLAQEAAEKDGRGGVPE